jgi:hypothetical protein
MQQDDFLPDIKHNKTNCGNAVTYQVWVHFIPNKCFKNMNKQNQKSNNGNGWISILLLSHALAASAGEVSLTLRYHNGILNN